MYFIIHNCSKYYLTGFNPDTGIPEYTTNLAKARQYTKEIADKVICLRPHLRKKPYVEPSTTPRKPG